MRWETEKTKIWLFETVNKPDKPYLNQEVKRMVQTTWIKKLGTGIWHSGWQYGTSSVWDVCFPSWSAGVRVLVQPLIPTSDNAHCGRQQLILSWVSVSNFMHLDLVSAFWCQPSSALAVWGILGVDQKMGYLSVFLSDITFQNKLNK